MYVSFSGNPEHGRVHIESVIAWLVVVTSPGYGSRPVPKQYQNLLLSSFCCCFSFCQYVIPKAVTKNHIFFLRIFFLLMLFADSPQRVHFRLLVAFQ